MTQMLNRCTPFVFILVSILLLAGCSSGQQGNQTTPNERANAIIKEANGKISDHNRLFQKARNSYAATKEAIESKGGEPSQQKEKISGIIDTMRGARQNLNDAQSSLQRIQGLDVSRPVSRYARALSEGINAQLAAEKKEIQFYEILREDPAIADNRERAQKALDGAQQDYEKAQEGSNRATKIAEQNPQITSASETPAGGTTGG
jgi:rubrerythrin